MRYTCLGQHSTDSTRSVSATRQKPKLAPYIMSMQENVATALACDVQQINIKATTEEKLGFTGNEEGISAHSVVLIEKI